MLWDLNEGKHLYTLHAQQETINALVFSPNRYWLCAATGPTIKVWVRIARSHGHLDVHQMCTWSGVYVNEHYFDVWPKQIWSNPPPGVVWCAFKQDVLQHNRTTMIVILVIVILRCCTTLNRPSETSLLSEHHCKGRTERSATIHATSPNEQAKSLMVGIILCELWIIKITVVLLCCSTWYLI